MVENGRVIQTDELELELELELSAVGTDGRANAFACSGYAQDPYY